MWIENRSHHCTLVLEREIGWQYAVPAKYHAWTVHLTWNLVLGPLTDVGPAQILLDSVVSK
jgi:hypothetical protein